MNQWQSIQNSFKDWRREQVLWIAVVIIGLIVLGGWWFLVGQRPPPAPVPETTSTPTASVTASPSELPTLEDLPYEMTQSDVDIDAPTLEGSGEDTPGIGTVTESPTWFVQPFTSRTPTKPPVTGGGGGGGGGFSSSTPNRYWTQYAQTSTAFARTGTQRARITNTFLAPTRQTATEGVKRTATMSSYLTSIARTPRPEQLAFSRGGSILLMPATPVPLPIPLPAPITVDGGNMGDWAPGGLRFVYEEGGVLYIQEVNVDGTAKGGSGRLVIKDRNGIVIPGPYYQPMWSPNGSWIVFVVGTPGAGGSSLYRIHWDGTDLQRLTDGLAPVAMPDWSPDTGKVVFSSGGDLWTINVNPYPLAALPVNGQHVLAAPQPRLRWQITDTATATATDTETATATATETATNTATIPPTVPPPGPTATSSRTPTLVPSRQQITFTGGASWPHYAPDGKSILFQRAEAGNDEIYLLLLSSWLEPQNMTRSSATDERYPFWSRDSSRFGYVSNRGGSYGIYYQVQNSAPVLLFSDPSEISLPNWRP